MAAGAGWWLYKKLDGNITADTAPPPSCGGTRRSGPPRSCADAQNILLIGSDIAVRRRQRRVRPGHGGTQRSDTTILLHLAADRQSATAVSLPRDLMVDDPELPAGRTARRTGPQFAQFNWAFEVGGAACTIRTVEKLTGIRIDHHMVVDFSGFKEMVDAVDGVEVCLDGADRRQGRAAASCPPGRQKLDGEQALGYVRARKSLGDGSDTERMDRQQQFLGALVKKVQSNGVLLNPARLYPVLDAATSSLTTDPGLASCAELYDLVRGMRDIPTEQVQFLTVPRQPYAYDRESGRTRRARRGASSSSSCATDGPWRWSRRTRRRRSGRRATDQAPDSRPDAPDPHARLSAAPRPPRTAAGNPCAAVKQSPRHQKQSERNGQIARL